MCGFCKQLRSLFVGAVNIYESMNAFFFYCSLSSPHTANAPSRHHSPSLAGVVPARMYIQLLVPALLLSHLLFDMVSNTARLTYRSLQHLRWFACRLRGEEAKNIAPCAAPLVVINQPWTRQQGGRAAEGRKRQ